MTSAPHILIVDDHREIRDLVSRALTKEGFRVSSAGDGKAMRKLMTDARIDLVLLDLMLPGESGLALARELRSQSNIPIIMVTAKGEEVDRVVGLEVGADDYLPKPFGTRELIARINAVLRRTRMDPVRTDEKPKSKRYKFDRFVFNVETRDLVRDDDVTIALSTGEFDLLLVLVERPQRVLTRDQLLDLARGRSANGFDRSIDTQVSRLRKKLEVDPHEPEDPPDGVGWRLHAGSLGERSMTRILPRTLFGQTLAILLAGLILSQLAGAWIYLGARREAVRAVGGLALAQRVANLTRLIQEAPTDWRDKIVKASSDPTFRLSIANKGPEFSPTDADQIAAAKVIEDFLASELALAGNEKIYVRLRDTSTQFAPIPHPSGVRPWIRARHDGRPHDARSRCLEGT